MGGIGVRAHELACAISVHASVTIVSAVGGDLSTRYRNLAYSDADVPQLIKENDFVFFFDLASPQSLLEAAACNKFIVVENAIPIEHLEYNSGLDKVSRRERYSAYLEEFKIQMMLADHFICRSQVERLGIISSLLWSGRVVPNDVQMSRTLSHLITDIPIGCLKSSVDMIDDDITNYSSNLYLWNGGLWDYMNYQFLIEDFSLSSKNVDTNNVLEFMYKPPMDQSLTAHSIFNEGIAGPHISLWPDEVNHSSRANKIRKAKAFVTFAKKGIENETCIRLRLRDTFAHGIPVIIDNNGATGELVAELGIGLSVESNRNSLTEALRIFDDIDRYTEFRRNIREESSKRYLDINIIHLMDKLKSRNEQSIRGKDELERIIKLSEKYNNVDIERPFIT